MNTAMALRTIQRKKYQAEGDVSQLWTLFYEELSKENLDTKVLTLSPYSNRGYILSWDEFVNMETGEVLNPREYEQVLDKSIYRSFYNPVAYIREVKRLKKLSKVFLQEGFSVSVGFDKNYKNQRTYPPYMVVSW